jgi:hypothetical protein
MQGCLQRFLFSNKISLVVTALPVLAYFGVPIGISSLSAASLLALRGALQFGVDMLKIANWGLKTKTTLSWHRNIFGKWIGFGRNSNDRQLAEDDDYLIRLDHVEGLSEETVAGERKATYLDMLKGRKRTLEMLGNINIGMGVLRDAGVTVQELRDIGFLDGEVQ